MTELYRAMISSTTKDMLVHRQQALDACIRQDFFPVMMEHLPPSPDDAVRRSLKLVDEADVYVLVLGLRYGEIPGGYEKSYTHLELDRAIERGIPILALLTSQQHPFTETDIDLGAAGDRVRRLTEQELRVLHTVAAFRSPTVFPTLAALLVGGDRPCATQAELDRVLTDLEDRGLLGWDRVSNRYDLHPVVRGVVWSSLDPDARHGIDLRLARHLGEAPEVDQDSVTSVDDLSNTIELYHMLVRLGQLNDASTLLRTRICPSLVCLGGYRYLAELARVVIVAPDWPQKAASEDLDKTLFVYALMGAGYQFAGDPVRALDSYDLFSPGQFDEDLVFSSSSSSRWRCASTAALRRLNVVLEPHLHNLISLRTQPASP